MAQNIMKILQCLILKLFLIKLKSLKQLLIKAEFYSWTYNMDQSQEPVNTDTESIKMSPQYRFIY